MTKEKKTPRNTDSAKMKSFHLRWASHLPNMGSVFASLYQVSSLNSTFIIRWTNFIISTQLDRFTRSEYCKIHFHISL